MVAFQNILKVSNSNRKGFKIGASSDKSSLLVAS